MYRVTPALSGSIGPLQTTECQNAETICERTTREYFHRAPDPGAAVEARLLFREGEGLRSQARSRSPT